jgi:hypothetical protein
MKSLCAPPWHGGSRIGAERSPVEVTPGDDAGFCDVKIGKDRKRLDFQGLRDGMARRTYESKL